MTEAERTEFLRRCRQSGMDQATAEEFTQDEIERRAPDQDIMARVQAEMAQAMADLRREVERTRRQIRTMAQVCGL